MRGQTDLGDATVAFSEATATCYGATFNPITCGAGVAEGGAAIASATVSDVIAGTPSEEIIHDATDTPVIPATPYKAILVLAHVGADAAGSRAFLGHILRPQFTLPTDRPECTVGNIHIPTRAGCASAAAEGAVDERVPGIFHALALCHPAGAVVHGVLALALAHAAGHRAVQVHDVGPLPA